MTMSELQDAIARGAGLSKKDATAALTAMTQAVLETLKAGGDVRLGTLGTFSTTNRAAKMGRNPRTGEAIEIKAAVRPTFKPAKSLTEALNVTG